MKSMVFSAALTLLIHGLLLSGLGDLLLKNGKIQEPRPIALSLSLIRRPAVAPSGKTDEAPKTERPEPIKSPEAPVPPPAKPVPVERVEEPPVEKPAPPQEPPKVVAPQPKAPEKDKQERKPEVRPQKKEPERDKKAMRPAEPRPSKRPEKIVKDTPRREPPKETQEEKVREDARPEIVASTGGSSPARANPFSDLAEKTKEVYPQTSSSGKGSSISAPPVGPVTEAVPIYRQNPVPEYPLIARRRGYEGTVVLEALISERGRVKDLRVSESSRHAVLDEAALETVKRWLFEPARRGNQKIEMWVRVPVCFKLK